jgi:hypothetical protein
LGVEWESISTGSAFGFTAQRISPKFEVNANEPTMPSRLGSDALPASRPQRPRFVPPTPPTAYVSDRFSRQIDRSRPSRRKAVVERGKRLSASSVCPTAARAFRPCSMRLTRRNQKYDHSGRSFAQTFGFPEAIVNRANILGISCPHLESRWDLSGGPTPALFNLAGRLAVDAVLARRLSGIGRPGCPVDSARADARRPGMFRRSRRLATGRDRRDGTSGWPPASRKD